MGQIKPGKVAKVTGQGYVFQLLICVQELGFVGVKTYYISP